MKYENTTGREVETREVKQVDRAENSKENAKSDRQRMSNIWGKQKAQN
jgi:hypothetical protein